MVARLFCAFSHDQEEKILGKVWNHWPRLWRQRTNRPTRSENLFRRSDEGDGWEGLLTTWHAPRMIDSSKLLILHIHCHCFTSWRERCCESLLCPWSKVRQNRNAVLDGWPHHEDINQIWLRQLVRPWPPFSSRMKMAKFYWLGGLCSQLPQQQP